MRAVTDSAEVQTAWDKLIASGCEPTDYMLMWAADDLSTPRYAFKNIDSRRYVYVR